MYRFTFKEKTYLGYNRLANEPNIKSFCYSSLVRSGILLIVRLISEIYDLAFAICCWMAISYYLGTGGGKKKLIS